MRSGMIAALAVSVIALSACNRQETPAQTQRDVASAQMKGAEKVDDAIKDANKTDAQASKEVQNANADVELTKANADYKVAVAQCEAQTGPARDACNSKAQAALDAEKARIEASKPH